MFTVKCACGESQKIDVNHAIHQLRWKRKYSFGDHVSDPRAFIVRWLTVVHGWMYTDGRLGKTTISMTCQKCLLKARVEHLRESMTME